MLERLQLGCLGEPPSTNEKLPCAWKRDWLCDWPCFYGGEVSRDVRPGSKEGCLGRRASAELGAPIEMADE